ncbi:MAG: YibE/F family protein [Patescibacteria group bacterium]|nr:YibE/F family protein [Patescibacteria group bacterium]
MKKIILIIAVLLCLFPFQALAQENLENNQKPETDEVFKARVIEIIEEQVKEDEHGHQYRQQNIKLKGLEDEWQDKEIIFYGISDIQVLSKKEYQIGDKVLVTKTTDSEGDDKFYITDYVRQGSLYWLAALFALVIIVIGRLKGLRALIALVISFLVIMKFIIPQILNGVSPILISIIGAIMILFCIIYITEGFNKKSHLAVLSIIIALIITAFISSIFTDLAKLTGLAQEETLFLIASGRSFINLKGLLLAAIIIGALGVLDDVVISQIATCQEIKKANSNLSRREIFKRAFRVGKSHMGSMVNTLFLAYAGASLPLLLLFTVNEPPFLSFGDVINHEVIATEIVRTLTGSIGLILAIPIATYLAAYFLNVKKIRPPKETS